MLKDYYKLWVFLQISFRTLVGVDIYIHIVNLLPGYLDKILRSSLNTSYTVISMLYSLGAVRKCTCLGVVD